MHSDDIISALRDFRSSLAGERGPDAPWAALQALAERIVGVRLFTIMTVDLDAGLARRLYTNMPEAYPVSGTKPMSQTPWFEQVVVGKAPFVANTLHEIAQHFFDHELIGELGCGSCLNLPVVVGGKMLGTVNLLDAEHHFTPERVAAAEHLGVPAMAAFLA